MIRHLTTDVRKASDESTAMRASLLAVPGLSSDYDIDSGYDTFALKFTASAPETLRGEIARNFQFSCAYRF